MTTIPAVPGVCKHPTWLSHSQNNLHLSLTAELLSQNWTVTQIPQLLSNEWVPSGHIWDTVRTQSPFPWVSGPLKQPPSVCALGQEPNSPSSRVPLLLCYLLRTLPLSTEVCSVGGTVYGMTMSLRHHGVLRGISYSGHEEALESPLRTGWRSATQGASLKDTL